MSSLENNNKNIKKKRQKKSSIDKKKYEQEIIEKYDFNMIDEIKIYNSILINNKSKLNFNIDILKVLHKEIFTSIVPSTLTAKGAISNISFTEIELIKKLEIPDFESKIIKIGCNFGEIIKYPNPYKDYDIQYLIDLILLYKKNNYKLIISCNCTNLLENIDVIYDKILLIVKKKNRIKYILDQVNSKLIVEQNFTKKSINRIFKNISLLEQYKPISKDDVKEIYNIMDYYINNKKALTLTLEYFDNLIDIISYFIKIENDCLCLKKYHSSFNIEKNKIKSKKAKFSNRGRKPKEKSKPTRKAQGTGKYFSSQITFDVYNEEYNKIYKIKLFRNGNWGIPGGKDPNMRDLIPPLRELVKYLQKFLDNSNININYLLSVMRNYTCKIINKKIHIILDNLEEVLNIEKNAIYKDKFDLFYSILSKYNKNNKIIKHAMQYIDVSIGNISEINNNTERYPGLLIKFNQPIPGNPNKKMTVKILSGGKINFDGANSEKEVYEIYYWLQYVFDKYWKDIVFDPDNIKYSYDSEELDSDCESIYDDDFEKLRKYDLL